MTKTRDILTRDLEDILMAHIASRVFELVKGMKEFPYDLDEKRSRDKRKVLGEPYHLKDRGGAFAGTKQIAGTFFQGHTPQIKHNEIVIDFYNPKLWRDTLFEYADVTKLPELFKIHPSNAELERIVEEAVDLWWR